MEAHELVALVLPSNRTLPTASKQHSAPTPSTLAYSEPEPTKR